MNFYTYSTFGNNPNQKVIKLRVLSKHKNDNNPDNIINIKLKGVVEVEAHPQHVLYALTDLAGYVYNFPDNHCLFFKQSIL